MSIANQHSRTSVQRLRREEIATSIPGSQGQDPRTLRPERLKWLSIPHPKRPDGRRSITSSASAMGANVTAKNEPAAKIAVFPKWKCHRQPSHTRHAEVPTQWASKHGPVIGRFTLRGCFAAPQGEDLDTSIRRAFAHHTYHLPSRRPQGPKPGRDYPSTFFRHGA